METLQAWMQADALEQLGNLETRVNREAQQQAEVEQKLSEIRQLRARAVELTRRKIELQQRLRHIPADCLGARILKDVEVGDVPTASLPPEKQREVVAKAAQQERLRQLDYTVVAHRCAGITASLIPGKRRVVRIRFETMYKGEYFEPFYLQIHFQEKMVKPSWHTIPVFVPLSNLLEKYSHEETHFTTVLTMIHSYLTAFVQRRQQTLEFARKYSQYLREDIASFCAYDFIQLVLDVPIEGSKVYLILHLHYKDLCSDLPSRVRCSDPGDLPIGRVRIKQAFRTLPMAEAFQNLFLDQSFLQG